MRTRCAEKRGFTLMELMIVVGIVGVLAAVVIPNWASTARNGRYDPEITSMFAEIATRQEQYRSEIGNGLYLPAPVCPSMPSPNGIDFNSVCVNAGSPWATLRVNPTDRTIRCSYAVVAGPGGMVPTLPPGCPPAVSALAGSWYFIVAMCDMDGSGGTNATFCTTSWNNQHTKLNYGK